MKRLRTLTAPAAAVAILILILLLIPGCSHLLPGSVSAEELIQKAQSLEEKGQTEEALDLYRKASRAMEYEEGTLSVRHRSCLLPPNGGVSLAIVPAVNRTKDFSILVSGENLTPDHCEEGRITNETEVLSGEGEALTTDWFEVDPDEKWITLTGIINCAIWQFRYEDGTSTVRREKAKVCNASSVEIASPAFSSVIIPEGSEACRVTFFDRDNPAIEEDSGIDRIRILYGKGQRAYTDLPRSEISLPDLTAGESITFDGQTWSLVKEDGETEKLDLAAPPLDGGTRLTVRGDICGQVSLDCKPGASSPAGTEDPDPGMSDKAKEYGVRYSTRDGVTVCSRLGDAAGMSFNYILGDERTSFGGRQTNDFDLAYPWSEMKVCNVTAGRDGKPSVIYEGEEGFSRTGEHGEVMVEIPRFYVKRVQTEDTEEIWICGEQRKGYVPDPVFQSGDRVLDRVYVGAYIGSYQDETLRSVSGRYPAIRVPYGDLIKAAQAGGKGFGEMNYFMYSAIQKLYLVETGVLDASTLFSGESFLYFYTPQENLKKTGTAIEDAASSNTITVVKNTSTKKIQEGTSVALLTTEKGWEECAPGKEDNLREVTGVEEEGKNALKITFSGQAIDIVKGQTVIAGYPSMTGKTDGIDYCTGVYRDNSGWYGFKYRGIENPYGSALIMMDRDAYIQNGEFWFSDGDGGYQRLDARLPLQETALDISVDGFASGNVHCVRQYSYDPSHPTIMVPVQADASSYSYYTDLFILKTITDGKKYYLCGGSAIDNKRLGGIFCMRGLIKSDQFFGNFHSGRIIFRE